MGKAKKNKVIIKSKEVVCTMVCYKCIKFKINNYDIFLYGCKNKYKIESEYEETQKIDLSKIIILSLYNYK